LEQEPQLRPPLLAGPEPPGDLNEKFDNNRFTFLEPHSGHSTDPSSSSDERTSSSNAVLHLAQQNSYIGMIKVPAISDNYLHLAAAADGNSTLVYSPVLCKERLAAAILFVHFTGIDQGLVSLRGTGTEEECDGLQAQFLQVAPPALLKIKILPDLSHGFAGC